MTKGAVAKESPAKRKSLGKNETPSKQKLLNAVSKTPNSAVKQINTPRSGSKPQANVSINLSLNDQSIFCSGHKI